MTSFQNGPAHGVTLSLSRSPHFLRVVRDEAGKWDALDQLTDEPKKDEEIHVYVLWEGLGTVHVHRSGGRGGFEQMSTYRYHPLQPADATMRHLVDWREWCLANSTPEMRERSPRR